MLTKKDYIKLAQLLKEALEDAFFAGSDTDYAISLEILIAKICDWLQADNPRFDQDTFKDACGL